MKTTNTPRTTRARPLALVALLALAPACGGDDETKDDGPKLETSLAGVYAINTWTENESGCDAEGSSVLEGQSSTNLGVRLGSLFGSEFLAAVPCSDAMNCAAQTQNGFSVALSGGALMTSGSDAMGWEGESSSTVEFMGMCEDTYSVSRLTVVMDKKVRLETKSFDVKTKPSTVGDEPCPLDDVKAAAKDAPCSRLSVLTATYSGPIGEGS